MPPEPAPALRLSRVYITFGRALQSWAARHQSQRTLTAPTSALHASQSCLLERALADAEIGYQCQTENSSNAADPMKREILDPVKRWYQYDWLAMENKLGVVPAEAGTHFRWIHAFAGMTRL